MAPARISTSYATRALETGDAKLWALLVGVNQYQDGQLPPLRYPAMDCQGLGSAIATATALFPRKSITLHADRTHFVLPFYRNLTAQEEE